MDAIDDKTYREMAEYLFKKRFKDHNQKGVNLDLFVSEIYSIILAYIKYTSSHMGGGQETMDFLNQVLHLLELSADGVMKEIYKPEVNRINDKIKQHIKEGKL